MIFVPRNRYYIPLNIGRNIEYNLDNNKYIVNKPIKIPMVMNSHSIKKYFDKVVVNSKSKNKLKKYDNDVNSKAIVKYNLLRDPGIKLEEEFSLQRKKLKKEKEELKIFKALLKDNKNLD